MQKEEKKKKKKKRAAERGETTPRMGVLTKGLKVLYFRKKEIKRNEKVTFYLSI